MTDDSLLSLLLFSKALKQYSCKEKASLYYLIGWAPGSWERAVLWLPFCRRKAELEPFWLFYCVKQTCLCALHPCAAGRQTQGGGDEVLVGVLLLGPAHSGYCGMVWLKGILKMMSFQLPLSQVAPGSIQPVPGHFQGLGSHSSGLYHPHKEPFANI